MTSKTEAYKLAALAMQAGIKASEAIIKVYNTPFAFDNKADGSPITLADRRSNEIILETLLTTGIPVVSEETLIADYSERRQWEYFWLVDPLDGTKEFISRNGEFSINIALMRASEPWLGIIVAPAEDMAWWGLAGEQPFRINSLPFQEHLNANDLLQHSTPLIKKIASEQFAIAVSRSHMEPQTLNLIEQIKRKRGAVELIERGSALKFCDLIEGRSDLYIRYSPTWEWDTAAGHALLLAHGGALFHITEHKPLAYNKAELNNPGFIAFARAEASVWYFSELSF
jgi:3'(2'), 5'-bisphosphate nucleotidase